MSRMALLVVTLTGCLGDSSDPPVTEDDFSGGAIMVEGCGWPLVTPDQATAPVRGSASLGSDPSPWGVHLALPGPDAATSVAMLWQTRDDDTLATTVQYGEAGATDKSVTGYTFKVKLGPAESRPTMRMHEAHVCGLKPGTAYTYRVGGKDGTGREKWSEPFTFRTAPAPGSPGPLTIGVIGDSRGNYAQWEQMIGKLAATGQPDVIFFSGDAVTLGSLQKEWDPFFDKAEKVLARIPMVFAHGNHEANLVNFYAQIAQPLDEVNFGLDYGPVHLTVLNDTTRVYGEEISTVKSFLEKDLSQHDMAPWKILMHHQPLYSSASAHGSNIRLRGAWLPVIDAHRVDVVLAGHDHDYERSKPLRGDMVQVSPNDGTTYVVAGGAGAELYTAGTNSWTELSKATYHFVVLKVAGKTFEMKTWDDMGTLLDMVSWTKP